VAYSKSQAAKDLGISKKELENRAKAAGFDNTEAYWNFIGGASAPIIDQIKKQIIELDKQLDSLSPLGITDEEKEAFLNKAIEQVQPYYDRKTKEIETGIAEGTLRTAEDVLLYIRDVENEVKTSLEKLDLSQAQTEEEFLNRIADITATKQENVQAKREEWRLRLENTKMEQIQSGTLTSGIGAKKREEVKRLEGMETGTIEARAGREQLDTETANKYTLDQIRLAREASERDRVARIGAPQETEATKQEALAQAGLSGMEQLGSKADIELARGTGARNVSTYKPDALTSLEEERLKAVESRKQELQSEELTLREKEYEKQRQKILSARDSARSNLAAYGGY